MNSHLKRVLHILVVICSMGVGLATAATPDRAAWNRQAAQSPRLLDIQQRMSLRHKEHLKGALDAGAVAITETGWMVARDGKDRRHQGLSEAVRQAIQDENKDRRLLYQELAEQQGHPEWEESIQHVFANEWIEVAAAQQWYVVWSDGSCNPPKKNQKPE